jgi:hypothetical protein
MQIQGTRDIHLRGYFYSRFLNCNSFGVDTIAKGKTEMAALITRGATSGASKGFGSKALAFAKKPWVTVIGGSIAGLAAYDMLLKPLGQSIFGGHDSSSGSGSLLNGQA